MPDPMLTPDQFDAIRARVDATTAGPWYQDRALGSFEHRLHDRDGCRVLAAEDVDPNQSRLNAEFAARARTDVPALLGHAEGLAYQLARSNRARQQQAANIERMRKAEQFASQLADSYRDECADLRRVLGAVAALAEERLPDDARMDAYYFGFERTGVGIIDAILSQVAIAGKGSHSTETWQDDPFSRGTEASYQDRIQAAANDALSEINAVLAPVSGGQRCHECGGPAEVTPCRYGGMKCSVTTLAPVSGAVVKHEQPCERIEAEVGHDDEGPSCVTHNMPWGECPHRQVAKHEQEVRAADAAEMMREDVARWIESATTGSDRRPAFPDATFTAGSIRCGGYESNALKAILAARADALTEGNGRG